MHPVTAVILLGALTAALFLPACNYDFVYWDDHMHIGDNPYLNRPTAGNVARFWKAPYKHLYIPVTYTVWAGIGVIARHPGKDGGAGSLSPRPFHAFNIGVHVFSVVAVFWILGTLFPDRIAAFCGALLFALHPIQVEPVVWISGLRDLLCGFFSLCAVGCYLTYVKGVGREESPPFWGYFILATGCFVLALLSKPLAVVVPLMVWILIWCYFPVPVPGNRRRVYLQVTVWVAIGVVFSIVTMSTQKAVLGAVTPLWARPLIAGDAIFFYLSKLFYPVGLAIDYGRTPERVLSGNTVGITAVVTFGGALLLWRWHRTLKPLIGPMMIFIAGILPVLGLIPFAYQTYSTVADRYLYLSMLGPAVLFAGLIQRQSVNRGLTIVCGLLLIGGFAALSGFQVPRWQDNKTLFAHTLSINPKSSGAHTNLGLAYAREKAHRKAAHHYRQAIQLRWHNAKAHNNLGILQSQEGLTDAAVQSFRNAVRIDPEFSEAYYNAGIVLESKGTFDKAIDQYIRAIETDAYNIKATNNLGVLLTRLERYEQAIRHFAQLLEIAPEDVLAHRNLKIARDRLSRKAASK